jgi:hypothetical protein
MWKRVNTALKRRGLPSNPTKVVTITKISNIITSGSWVAEAPGAGGNCGFYYSAIRSFRAFDLIRSSAKQHAHPDPVAALCPYFDRTVGIT